MQRRGGARHARAVLQRVEVLREACARMSGVLRARDLAGRFGGEELCVLLPGTDRERAVVVADRLRAAVSSETVCGVRITLSVGVAVAGDAVATLDDLLSAADRAVYDAKDDGRDCVVAHVVTCPALAPQPSTRRVPARR